MIVISLVRTTQAIDRIPTGMSEKSIKNSIHTYPENQVEAAKNFIIESARKGYSVLVTQGD